MDNTEWECMECGFLHEGKTPPRKCPDCGSAGTWEKVEYVDDWDDEDEAKDGCQDEDDA
jgi:rubredoxin